MTNSKESLKRLTPMRKPKRSEFDQGDGNGIDHDAYDEKMSDFEDAERDRQLEEKFERDDIKDSYADSTDKADKGNKL